MHTVGSMASSLWYVYRLMSWAYNNLYYQGTKPTTESNSEGGSGEGEDEGDKGEADEGDEGEAEDREPDSNSAVEMVTKAEQWCKEALKESQPDHTWCTRLALTYVGMEEIEAAVKQYEQVQSYTL